METTEGIHWLAAWELNVGFLAREKRVKWKVEMERNESRGMSAYRGQSVWARGSILQSPTTFDESVADPYDHAPTVFSESLQSSLRDAIASSNPVTYAPTARLCYLPLHGQSPRNPQLKTTYGSMMPTSQPPL